MTVNAANAAQAYAQAAKQIQEGLKSASSTNEADGGLSFGDILKDTVKDVIDTSKAGEAMSIKAMTGEADIVDVVTAISAAEMTLETVVAVRDKVISAYQEIMRMPI